jgi:hypothetical protein
MEGMVPMTERARYWALAAALTTTLAACVQPAGSGFRPLPVDEVPKGSAVVHLYRARSLLGTVDLCNMTVGDELVGALEAGQYTRIVVPVGKTRFATAGPYLAYVTVNVSAGSEVFIRQRWVFRLDGFRPTVDRMTRIKAVAELERCVFVEELPIFEEPDESSEEPDESSEERYQSPTYDLTAVRTDPAPQLAFTGASPQGGGIPLNH